MATCWHLSVAHCAGLAERSWCWCVPQPAETRPSLGDVNEGHLSAGNLCICLGCWTRQLCRVCWLPEQRLTHCLILLPNNVCLKVFDYFEVEVSVVTETCSVVTSFFLSKWKRFVTSELYECLREACTEAPVNVGFLFLHGFIFPTSCSNWRTDFMPIQFFLKYKHWDTGLDLEYFVLYFAACFKR